jgi:aminodeoxyfutalosine deaminase
MILRSRLLLPITGPPIENGALSISRGRIAAVGSWSELRREKQGAVVDLDDAILLPGLINAHCHCDYTDMAGMLARGKSFSDWVKAIVALKAQWSYADFAQSWIRGARQLLRSGTTTVVDIEAVPELLPEVLSTTPLRVISCLEVMSLKHPGTPRQIVSAAAERVASWTNENKGLAPHAPYTTTPGVVWECAETARKKRWLSTSHVAESREEFDMFTRSRGRLFDWLKPQRDMSDCVGRTPIEQMDSVGLLDAEFLATHANYVTDEDIALLARRSSHVAHCPRSHDYFGHEPFRYEDMSVAGINICLGTDSMASVRKQRGEPMELNLFAELRTLRAAHPEIAPSELLLLVTINAARAIGCAGELGELKAGARADVIAIPFSQGDPFETVIAHRDNVAASMIAGRWALPPKQ